MDWGREREDIKTARLEYRKKNMSFVSSLVNIVYVSMPVFFCLSDKSILPSVCERRMAAQNFLQINFFFCYNGMKMNILFCFFFLFLNFVNNVFIFIFSLVTGKLVEQSKKKTVDTTFALSESLITFL